MATRKTVTQVGKVVGSVLLLVAASMFAVFALRNFPGWAFGLSLLLLVLCGVPFGLMFRLTSWNTEGRRSPQKPVDLNRDTGLFDDPHRILYDDSSTDKY